MKASCVNRGLFCEHVLEVVEARMSEGVVVVGLPYGYI